MVGAAAAGCTDTYGLMVPPVDRLRGTAARTSLRAGDTTTIGGEAYDERGALIDHRRRAAYFASRDTAVVTVAGMGLATLTARGAGATWIVGESGGKRDSVRITVTP